MRHESIKSCIGGVLFLLWVLASPAVAYDVIYDYYVSAADSDGIPLMDDAILAGQTYVDGDYTKLGGFGNYGSAVFYANLLTATVSSRAHALGTQTGPSGTSSDIHLSRSDVSIAFRDKLIFTVPAGYYPDGVQVSIGGRATGTVVSDVGAGSRVSCRVSLYSQVFDTGLQEVGITEAGTIQIDEPFLLTVQMVLPGTTLASQREYSYTLYASINSGITWSVAYLTDDGYVTGAGDFDFTDGLKITHLQVTPGVTWTSESGAFPGLPTGISDGTPLLTAPRLLQNHPNPFNPRTTIRFELPAVGHVRLAIYDVAGRLVRVLVEGEIAAGSHEAAWDGRDAAGRAVPSGSYLARLVAGGKVEGVRLSLVR